MSDVANALATGMSDMLALAEGVAGYVKRLKDGGISASVAEQMGVEYHAVLMEQMRNAQENQRRHR